MPLVVIVANLLIPAAFVVTLFVLRQRLFAGSLCISDHGLRNGIYFVTFLQHERRNSVPKDLLSQFNVEGMPCSAILTLRAASGPR
jgi:hypothetical protein